MSLWNVWDVLLLEMTFFSSDIQILLASCVFMATSDSLTWERECLPLSALQFPHLPGGVKQDQWLSMVSNRIILQN